MNMVKTSYNTTEDIFKKIQELEGETKLKFYNNISNYYHEMGNKNFQTQEDLFSINAQGISRIYHEVLLLMKFLQTKPQVKNRNINYYGLYYSVIKTRDENEVEVGKYENNENDYISLNDVIIANHYVGIKGR